MSSEKAKIGLIKAFIKLYIIFSIKLYIIHIHMDVFPYPCISMLIYFIFIYCIYNLSTCWQESNFIYEIRSKKSNLI